LRYGSVTAITEPGLFLEHLARALLRKMPCLQSNRCLLSLLLGSD
jgi:hypothetical protein